MHALVVLLAFSDPDNYAKPVSVGGGDHRFFTGSHADGGYACSVCHHDGPAPDFVVDGIPDTLVAGTAYTLVVHWPHPDVPHSLQLELVTPSGAHPNVAIPTMVPIESRCEISATQDSAIYTVDVGARRIVGVKDCGASAVAVSFVATGEPIELAIGGVVSDSDGTDGGDGPYELRTTLGVHLVATGGGGCSTSGGDAGWLLGLGAAGTITARRRRRAL